MHPEIEPYRKWGCPIYEELCTIFTKPKATGEFAITVGGYSRSGSNNLAHPRGNVNANISNGRNKRQSAQPVGSGPNKKHDKGTEKSKEINSVSKSSGTAAPQSDDPYSASHCIAIINGMQGVDRRTYNAALDLFQNSTWRKTFISLKSEKRLNWLKAMLPSI